MAQAEHVTSAIAALRIGASAKPSTNPVRGAHAEFVLAMAPHEPHPISIDANDSDLDDRAEHLTKVLTGLLVCAILDDTSQNISGSVDLAHVEAALSDPASDVGATIKQTADDAAGRLS
jgi:hypothetical protein